MIHHMHEEAKGSDGQYTDTKEVRRERREEGGKEGGRREKEVKEM